MHDTMVTRPDHADLFDIAAGQHGYFTSEQAREAGFGRDLLSYHASTGRFIRVQRGLYRIRDFPPYWREEVVAAWLAVGKDVAVVSHESALDLFELSDVIPNKVHLTIPRSKRYLRPPPDVAIHTTREPLQQSDVLGKDGMRVTTPTRSTVDAAESGTAMEQIVMAIRQAFARGLTTPKLLRGGAERRSRRVAELVLGEVERCAA